MFAPAASLLAGSGQQAHNIKEKELVQKFKLANASFEKAKSLYLKQNFAEAEKKLNECLGIMPEHDQAHFLLAQIAYRNNNLEKALEHIEKAEKYFDYIVKILVKQQEDRLFEIDKLRQQNEEMIATLKDMLSRATGSEERAKLQGQIAEQERQLANVRDRLKNPIPTIDKMPAEYHYFHGNILFRLKRFPEAEGQYLEAIQTDALHVNSYNNLINLYCMARQYDKALEYIEQAEKYNLQINEQLKKTVLQAVGR